MINSRKEAEALCSRHPFFAPCAEHCLPGPPFHVVSFHGTRQRGELVIDCCTEQTIVDPGKDKEAEGRGGGGCRHRCRCRRRRCCGGGCSERSTLVHHQPPRHNDVTTMSQRPPHVATIRISPPCRTQPRLPVYCARPPAFPSAPSCDRVPALYTGAPMSVDVGTVDYGIELCSRRRNGPIEAKWAQTQQY